MLRRIHILYFSLSVCCIGLAQDNYLTSKNKKAINAFNEGIKNLQDRKWDISIKKFKEAVERDSNFTDAHFQLGMLYKNFERNIPLLQYHFEKILKINKNYTNSLVYRILADIYLHDGAYANAKAAYTRYIKFGYKDPKPFLEKAQRYILICDFALQNIQHPVNIQPQRLPPEINKFNKQYFPVTTADQSKMVFTVREKIGSMEYEDMYISENKDGKWMEAQPISENINSANLNEGTCTISADGKVLVFTKCGGATRNDSDCDLYISYNEGNIWSKPVNMGTKINSPFWDSQPSLSPDGKTIYFSSKRPGGYGEEDIWMAQADHEGRWSPPLNLGDLINTPGREVAPFIHPTMSTFFFASDYHLGYGSFDIFYCYKDSLSNWSIPQNLGYPINTHLEESSIFITADCQKAYISAEAKTQNNNEKYYIYEFALPQEVSCKDKCTYAKGTVYDNDTKQPISAVIELINLKTNKSESFLKSDPVNGSYLIVLNENTQYGLYVQKLGYLYKSHAFNFENEQKFDPLNLDVYLDPIKQGLSITLNNIFFETGKYKLEKKSTAELDKLINFLNQNADLKVEISGHTDNVGLAVNNMNLSTKRAESVFDYLVENGIDQSRVKFKGYGDKMPVAPNDTDANRKQNRRIECKIL
ncbi:MAG: OmpA family protein [Cytophagales bacterium]|nr:OmpA family protein [Cytophagales bacterium]